VNLRAIAPAWSATPNAAAAAARYVIPIAGGGRRRLAIGWLLLALGALAASGVFSILLVLSRAPGVKDVFPLVDFFRVALVVHVDLSVLVWFLAFAGVLWSLNSTERGLAPAWAALALALTGTAFMSIAPFVGAERPVMSNYVPVLDDATFLAGLVIFAAGIALAVLRGMAAVPRVGVALDGTGALRFGLNASLVSAAVALIAFGWSFAKLPPGLDAKALYELLFWGGGHVLQFTYTLLMFVAWLWLADVARVALPLTPRVVTLLFGIGLASVFATPVIYLAYDVGSVEHHRLLTWLMRYGGGLAIAPLAAALVIGLVRAPRALGREPPLRDALITSLMLFGAGGVIGFLIRGSNVTIPAHYHGCIVGVTLALMGLAYDLLPRLGFGSPRVRLARWQLWLYAAGQLLHAGGLLWSGGYGVQRKVAGADQALRSTEQVVAMGVMGAGGLVAVIGGLLFIVIAAQCVFARRPGAGS
jgi:hypothetical protein